MKKQTAVEWLIEQISYKTTNGEIISYHKDISKLVEQANKMFEQHIINAFEQGEYTGRGFEDLTSEEYYNINFKSE